MCLFCTCQLQLFSFLFLGEGRELWCCFTNFGCGALAVYLYFAIFSFKCSYIRSESFFFLERLNYSGAIWMSLEIWYDDGWFPSTLQPMGRSPACEMISLENC